MSITRQQSRPRARSRAGGHWFVVVPPAILTLAGLLVLFMMDLPEGLKGFAFSIQSIGRILELEYWVVMLSAAAVGYGAWVMLCQVVWLATTQLILRSEGIEWRSGLMSRCVHPMPYARIESCRLRQSLLGRWLGYGTITVYGIGSAAIVMPDMNDAAALCDFLNKKSRPVVAPAKPGRV